MDNYNGGKKWDIMCCIRDNPVGYFIIPMGYNTINSNMLCPFIMCLSLGGSYIWGN